MQWLLGLFRNYNFEGVQRITRRRGTMMSILALAAGATAYGISRRGRGFAGNTMGQLFSRLMR